MDKAIRKNAEMEAVKKFDYSAFLNEQPIKKEKPLYLFETDKLLAEERELSEFKKLKGAANGY